MSWVATGVAVGGMVLGSAQGEAQRKQQAKANRANMEMNAAQTEFSPWTNIKPQGAQISPETSSAGSGALQGGLSGAMFAAQNKMGGFGGAGGGTQQPQNMAMLDKKYMPGYDPNRMNS